MPANQTLWTGERGDDVYPGEIDELTVEEQAAMKLIRSTSSRLEQERLSVSDDLLVEAGLRRT